MIRRECFFGLKSIMMVLIDEWLYFKRLQPPPYSIILKQRHLFPFSFHFKIAIPTPLILYYTFPCKNDASVFDHLEAVQSDSID